MLSAKHRETAGDALLRTGRKPRLSNDEQAAFVAHCGAMDRISALARLAGAEPDDTGHSRFEGQLTARICLPIERR